jgi:Glycosyl transferase family 11
MIVIKIIGGLGNQMFQYAAAKALSLEKKQQLVIDTTTFDNYKLHQFGLKNFATRLTFYNFISKTRAKLHNFFGNFTVYKEKQFNYNPDFFAQNTSSIYLEGYFQSERYFKKYENIIRTDFHITEPLKEKTIALINKMKYENAVSIHIRRGDYLQHAVHNTDKTEYYSLATQYLETKISNPVYYLFSDDMTWVKNNFKTNFETHYVDFNDASTNYEDLKLMSSCKHNIIANSSFSWWGAWLNSNPDKIVIAPQKWFNDQSRDYSDVLPENWIKL